MESTSHDLLKNLFCLTPHNSARPHGLDIPLKEGGPTMFEHLFSHPSTVARHRATPYAAERERYLTSCAQQGYAHTTLRLKARELLWIARKLRVYPDLHVTPAQLEAVASGWHDRQQCCGRTLAERLRSGASVLASRLQRIDND
jgi:hypothetical protein